MSGTRSVVWLLDDHEIRRASFASLLAPWAAKGSIDLRSVPSLGKIGYNDGNFVAETSDSQICVFALGGAELHDPHVMDSIASLMEALAGRPLVLLSDIDTERQVSLAIALGAHGLLSTRMDVSVAVAALEFILAGGTYFNRASLVNLCRTSGPRDAGTTPSEGILLSPSANPEPERRLAIPATQLKLIEAPLPPEQADGDILDAPPKLTARQTEVVEMLKSGLSNKEIARALDLSEATVKIFVRQVIKKFGAMNRTQVALLASLAMSRHDLGRGKVRAIGPSVPVPSTRPAETLRHLGGE